MAGNREAALALALAGWAVFPIWHTLPDGSCACGDPKRAQIGKHPRCGHGHTDASTDPEDIEIWWSNGEAAPLGFAWECHPDSNIGIAIPDGVIIVDIDPRNGGTETFRAITTQFSLPDTLEVSSGSGGAHFYYSCPKGLQFPKTLDGLGFGKGIDIKQLGGYVVAPGSVHKSGGVYAWADPDQPMVEAPQWLLELATPRRERKATKTRTRKHTELSDDARAEGDALIALIDLDYNEGHRHSIALGLGGYLRKQGKSLDLVEYVVSQLPATDPEMRMQAAEWAYNAENAQGYSLLKAHLSTTVLRGVEGVLKTRIRDVVANLKATKEQAKTRNAARNAAQPQEPEGGDAPPANAQDAPQDTDWLGLFEVWDPSEPDKEIEYICPARELGPGKCSAISAYANGGKTPFAMLQAICIARGVSFLGAAVVKKRVLYLAAEGARNARKKARRICRGLGFEFEALGDSFIFAEAPSGCLDGDYCEKLASLVEREGFGAIYIDTYGSALTGGIDHNTNEFSDGLKMLGSISDALGVTFIVLMHERKPAQNDKRSAGILMLAGSNSAAGALQQITTLTRPNDDDKTLFRVHCTREVERGFEDFLIRWSDVPRDVAASTVVQAADGNWGLRCSVVSNEEAEEHDPGEMLCRKILAAIDSASDPYGVLLSDLKKLGGVVQVLKQRDVLVRSGLIEATQRGKQHYYKKVKPK